MLSPHETDVVRRDPKLPGLATVLDAAAFVSTLAAAVSCDVDSARIRYVRYKPGRRGMVLYDVQSGADNFEVVATALSADGWRKYLATADLPPSTRNLPPGIADSLIALSAFPADRKLRCLSQLLDTVQRRPLLHRLFRNRPEWWNAELTPIAWRPSRRFVLRGDVDGQPMFALKGYCRSTFERAALAARTSTVPAGVRMPELVGTCNRHRLLAFEWLPGRLLADTFSRVDATWEGEAHAEPLESGRVQRPRGSAGASPSRFSNGIARLNGSLVRVGEALAKLHRHSSSAAGGSFCSDEQNLRQLADDIASLSPALADRVRTLTQTLIDRLRAEQPVVTTIHGDFYAKQVLLNDDGVSFIDFDESRTGTAWVDVGNFVAKLIWSGLRDELPQQYVTDCRQQFLDGYHRACRHSDAAALSTHIAIGLLRCVPHPFRRGFSDWPRMMETLVDAAWNELQPSRPSAVRVPGDVDDAMPMLRVALDPAVMQAELHTAGIITEDQQVRAACVMKHKRGRRCLIGYDIGTAAGGEAFTVLGKIRAKGLDSPSYRTQRALHQTSFAANSPDGISVPRPLGTIPHLNMWLQEMVPGEPLTSVMVRGGSSSLPSRVVDAILKVQHSAVATLRRHTVDDEVEILRERLTAAASERPDLSDRVLAVLANCRHIAERIAHEEPVTSHRDFFPDQVLVDGRRLWLLDFDLYCHAPRSLDAGNFIAHIIEQAIRQPEHRESLHNFAWEFRDSWVAATSDATAAECFTVLSLARHIQLSTLDPARRQFTSAILEAIEDSVRLMNSRAGDFAIFKRI